MTLTIDTNVLVYAFDREFPEKQRVAADFVARAMRADVLLTVQVLGEFLKVIGRKLPDATVFASAQAEDWVTIFPIVATSWTHVRAAAEFAARHKLQYWDAVIWQAARSAGATVFVSEDLQDGLSLGGMTVLNPFNPSNRDRLDRLLEPIGG